MTPHLTTLVFSFFSLSTLISAATATRNGYNRSNNLGARLNTPLFSPTGAAPNANGIGKLVVAHYIVGNTYSYSQADWLSNINIAVTSGIDGFALNVGGDSWQPDRVRDAYAAAAASGAEFKLFVSFDITSLPCGSAGDASIYRQYINDYAAHPNQYFYQGKQFVSTFGGEYCRFGQGDLNSAWNYAVKTGVTNQIAFIPSFFNDPTAFQSTPAMDGDFNWNGGWPSGGSDVSFDSDNNHIGNLGGRFYMAAVSPLFFTHYGYKNFIFRADNWLYNTRWELLVQNRAQVDMVQIISWNDYGESHYIGPIGADQPGSQAWVNGFDHQGWAAMTRYYATAWKTGAYPQISKDQIFLSARPHSRDATTNDSVGKPDGWQNTEDYLWAVVFATSHSQLRLSIGASSSTTTITPGVNKVKLALSPGRPRATLTESVTGATLVDFSPAGFEYTASPSAYNFNQFMAASS